MSGEKLERYTKQEKTCVKCGAFPMLPPGLHKTSWEGLVTRAEGIGRAGLDITVHAERLERTCYRCGYIWYEACLDDEEGTT